MTTMTSTVGRSVLALAMAAVAAAAAPALAVDEDDLARHPGYVALEELELFGPDGPQTDVDLRGPMMRLVAAATADSDPELSEALAGILRIRVLESEDLPDTVAARDAIAAAGRRLESAGWQRMIQVREDDELILVLTRADGDRLAGLTVLLAEDDEVSLVNLVGDIDPAMIGRLAAELDAVPDLGDLYEADR